MIILRLCCVIIPILGLMAGCAVPSASSVRLSDMGPMGPQRGGPVAALAMSGPQLARYVAVDPRTREPTGAEAVMQRDGPDETGAWRLRIGWKPRPGAQFRWTQQIEGDTAADESLRFLRISDRSNHRRASFEPGLVIAPALLGGAAQKQDLIVSLSDADGQRRLPAQRTITSAGRELVETPTGTHLALRVHIEAVASLGPITARRVMAVWLAEGAGVVAQYQADTLRVLGIPTGTRELLLLAAPVEGLEPSSPSRVVKARGGDASEEVDEGDRGEGRQAQ